LPLAARVSPKHRFLQNPCRVYATLFLFAKC
jgi:hypothetical protein